MVRGKGWWVRGEGEEQYMVRDVEVVWEVKEEQ